LAAAQAAEVAERVVTGDLDSMDLAAELGEDRFDVVLAVDVLEHLKSPERLLTQLKPLLAPTGRIIAAIPNVAHASVRLALLQGRFPYGDLGLLDRGHLRFFTRESVEDLFASGEYVLAQLDRLEAGINAGHVEFDPAAVPEKLAEELQRDPEALTYEFIVVAYPSSAVAAACLRTRIRGLESALQASEVHSRRALEDKERHIVNVEAMLEAQRQQTDVLQSRAQTLETAHQTLETTNQYLEAANRTLVDTVARADANADMQSEELAAFRVNYGEVRAKAEALQTALVTSEANVTQALADKDRHIANLEAMLARKNASRGVSWLRADAVSQSLGVATALGVNRVVALPVQPGVDGRGDSRLKISVVMPVYRVPLAILRETVGSVLAQEHENWELCIADDASGDAQLTEYLTELSRSDPRIQLVTQEQRGGISSATNAALGLATGPFVGFLDNDDLLDSKALICIAEALDRQPELDLLYTDEDKVTLGGVYEEPYFKPDWSPDLLLSNMYVGHFLVVRRSLVSSVEGLRSAFDGSQDYDLVLRVTEKTTRIGHIPHVLYHWRRVPGSTADKYSSKPYAHLAARRALHEATERRGLTAKVEDGLDTGSFRIRYSVAPDVRVSVIVPTRDRLDVLRACIHSLEATADLSQTEIIIVNNASVDPDTIAYLHAAAEKPHIKVLNHHIPFNYSLLNNFAVSQASGDVLLFLNNDTEALQAGWMKAMLEHALRAEVGVVGCRLLYPGPAQRIQHAGIALGPLQVAGHVHRGRSITEGTQYGPNRVANYSAVTGAAMMMRREVFETAGGFDERFAVAFNDLDLCLRVRELGLSVVYTPFATLVHHESLTLGKSTDGRRVASTEINRMLDKWGATIDADPFYNPNLPRDVEDFVPVLYRAYGRTRVSDEAPQAPANNPVHALPGIALHVLVHEGPQALARESLRYIRERI
jgi:GT2 family glycosyltransferase